MLEEELPQRQQAGEKAVARGGPEDQKPPKVVLRPALSSKASPGVPAHAVSSPWAAHSPARTPGSEGTGLSLHPVPSLEAASREHPSSSSTTPLGPGWRATLASRPVPSHLIPSHPRSTYSCCRHSPGRRLGEGGRENTGGGRALRTAPGAPPGPGCSGAVPPARAAQVAGRGARGRGWRGSLSPGELLLGSPALDPPVSGRATHRGEFNSRSRRPLPLRLLHKECHSLLRSTKATRFPFGVRLWMGNLLSEQSRLHAAWTAAFCLVCSFPAREMEFLLTAAAKCERKHKFAGWHSVSNHD